MSDQGWQRIETAPKDGREILAAIQVRHRPVGTCFWERHIIAFDPEEGAMHMDYETGWEWDDYTHWMPLPEPPEEP